jgi:hypothetical protein
VAVATAALVVFASLGGPTATAPGLRLWIPPGWHEVERRLTPCVDPVERLTVRGPGGGLVHIQESLASPRVVRRFPPRPQRFALRGRPTPIGCCAPTRRPGWFLHFRAGGRAFYAYVYGRTPQARRYAAQALGSLLVEPRGRR